MSRFEDSRVVAIELSAKDARSLYDHTGTMPWAPDSWVNNVRVALSETLAALAPEALHSDEGSFDE